MHYKESNWNGFKRYDFILNERNAILIEPKEKIKIAVGYLKPNTLMRFRVLKLKCLNGAGLLRTFQILHAGISRRMMMQKLIYALFYKRNSGLMQNACRLE